MVQDRWGLHSVLDSVQCWCLDPLRLDVDLDASLQGRDLQRGTEFLLVKIRLGLEEGFLPLSLVLRLIAEGKCANVPFDHVDLYVLHWSTWGHGHRGLP